MQRVRPQLLFTAATLVLLPCAFWAAMALYIDAPIAWLRAPLAILYMAAVAAVWWLVKARWRKLILTAGGFLLVLGWWLGLQPSNNRDWQPDLATLAYADVNEDKVTIHGIRNCEYRTETDFDVHYYDKTFDLNRIRTTDLYLVYWGSPHMAHTMVSFGFEGGDYVCISIETRKEKGESYSALRGLFRQFELIYVVADERDVVRLRTNYRKGEDAYLLRLNVTPTQTRAFFMEYLKRINSLKEHPEWYSALTQNCTTSIRAQRAASERAPWDWRLLVNGHGDELLYERGVIATNLALAEFKLRAHVNERARAADKSADFSRLIRQGVPGITMGDP